MEEKLKIIQDEFDAAIDEKQRCQAEADKTAFTIDLAHRLVNGLASENVRWRETVETYNTSFIEYLFFLFIDLKYTFILVTKNR